MSAACRASCSKGSSSSGGTRTWATARPGRISHRGKVAGLPLAQPRPGLDADGERHVVGLGGDDLADEQQQVADALGEVSGVENRSERVAGQRGPRRAHAGALDRHTGRSAFPVRRGRPGDPVRAVAAQRLAGREQAPLPAQVGQFAGEAGEAAYLHPGLVADGEDVDLDGRRFEVAAAPDQLRPPRRLLRAGERTPRQSGPSTGDGGEPGTEAGCDGDRERGGMCGRDRLPAQASASCLAPSARSLRPRIDSTGSDG